MSVKNSKILQYTAVFKPAKEGGYNVSFPEFPGCVTFGKNFEEAKQMAKEVLELWLEELASQKENIPMSTLQPIIYNIQVKAPKKVRVQNEASIL
jgi:predicted RNase H-like HicB family nuclease